MQQGDPFYGLFAREADTAGTKLIRTAHTPDALPDPQTGRLLRISTVELAGAICPACAQLGRGGFVSFVSDLRLAFACPNCREFVWSAGA